MNFFTRFFENNGLPCNKDESQRKAFTVARNVNTSLSETFDRLNSIEWLFNNCKNDLTPSEQKVFTAIIESIRNSVSEIDILSFEIIKTIYPIHENRFSRSQLNAVVLRATNEIIEPLKNCNKRLDDFANKLEEIKKDQQLPSSKLKKHRGQIEAVEEKIKYLSEKGIQAEGLSRELEPIVNLLKATEKANADNNINLMEEYLQVLNGLIEKIDQAVDKLTLQFTRLEEDLTRFLYNFTAVRLKSEKCLEIVELEKQKINFQHTIWGTFENFSLFREEAIKEITALYESIKSVTAVKPIEIEKATNLLLEAWQKCNDLEKKSDKIFALSNEAVKLPALLIKVQYSIKEYIEYLENKGDVFPNVKQRLDELHFLYSSLQDVKEKLNESHDPFSVKSTLDVFAGSSRNVLNTMRAEKEALIKKEAEENSARDEVRRKIDSIRFNSELPNLKQFEENIKDAEKELKTASDLAAINQVRTKVEEIKKNIIQRINKEREIALARRKVQNKIYDTRSEIYYRLKSQTFKAFKPQIDQAEEMLKAAETLSDIEEVALFIDSIYSGAVYIDKTHSIRYHQMKDPFYETPAPRILCSCPKCYDLKDPGTQARDAKMASEPETSQTDSDLGVPI